MADNVAITAGSGTTIATEDVAGVHYQKVKPVWGTDGVATMVSANDPMPVILTDDGADAIEITGGQLHVLHQDPITLAASTANIGDVDVLSIVPGTGATNLGKAEDAAHTTGDVGVMALGVRSNANGSLVGADGEYTPLSVDRRGGLRVTFDPGLRYIVDIPQQVHVASANTVHWDLFNADATAVVRVLSIRQIPGIITAVTGVAFSWLLERTTAVGTGGSALTPWLPDTTQTALDADITVRSKPTGGATQSTDLRNYIIHSEETNAGSIVIASMGGVELLPACLTPPFSDHGIILRQNQGLRCVQVTNSNAGNTGWIIGFAVE